MIELSPDTTIHELLEDHPFLLDFLVGYNPKFGLLKNPMMRATAGRVATLRKAAEMGGIEMDDLLEAVRGEVGRRTGDDGSPLEEKNGTEAERSGRVAELKSLIQDLHRGVSPEAARARFESAVKDVTPLEIGAMEEELIREGMPVEEITRLCDLHVGMVQGSLDRQEELKAPPGHPIHTCLAENEVITGLANRLGGLSGAEQTSHSGPGAWSGEFQEVLEEISGIDNHYLRKENELFPALERHGVTGPSQVMWGVHDEIRDLLKSARAGSASGSPEEGARAGAALARAVVEMVYKENRILLPLAQQTLTPGEWAQIRRGEDELGYAFQAPDAPFPEETPSAGIAANPGPPLTASRSPALQLPIVSAASVAPLPQATEGGFVDLGTGRLSLEQVDMMLRHLPIDISFVDADGFVRYYSETEERLFPRTPGAIGRHVENCHPPKSIHMVKEILEKFAAGERDVAEFWIEMQGRFIHIRYFAVRNPTREYLGCLEVTQDVTGIRALEGQRRLLEWS